MHIKKFKALSAAAKLVKFKPPTRRWAPRSSRRHRGQPSRTGRRGQTCAVCRLVQRRGAPDARLAHTRLAALPRACCIPRRPLRIRRPCADKLRRTGGCRRTCFLSSPTVLLRHVTHTACRRMSPHPCHTPWCSPGRRRGRQHLPPGSRHTASHGRGRRPSCPRNNSRRGRGATVDSA
jgi:hypothetical protein